MAEYNFELLRALVIEDNAHMRKLLRSLLHSMGIKEIVESADGEAGYKALREQRFDFVLTDLSMKPVDGIEFTKRVRTAPDSPNQYLPIVMVTGHTERARVEAARDAGVTEFLAKPITAQHLHQRISQIVERPRAFVRNDVYAGPDRRRRRDENFQGTSRRKADTKSDPKDDLALK